MAKTVVVLGASPMPERFAYKALKKLQQFGHKVILVNPNYETIEGLPVLPSLDLILEPVHTLTIYVSPELVRDMIEDILDLRPQRVILNPGAESQELIMALTENHIHFVKACTLVMLDTGVF
jgi:uncharacterized protein